MKSSGSVNNYYISITSLTCLNCIKHNGSRIGAFGGFDKINIRTIRPNLKLLYRGGTESVCCTEDNASALLFKAKSKLADCGCFADSVYADNKNYGGL